MSFKTKRPLIAHKDKKQFSTTLAEQIAELKTDELVNDFLQIKLSRQQTDAYMPNYHYINSFGILNDPNGLCFFKGKWHLFYQQGADSPEGEFTIYWGHAVSDDLVNWTELPYAICPEPEAMCWSGATVVEEDRVIALYYGHGNESGLYIAISSDPLLLNWEKIGPVVKKDKPWIPMPHCHIPKADEKNEFNVFDPCIWKQDDYYYALTGGVRLHPVSNNQMRNSYVLRSKNLTDWEYLHPLIDDHSFTEVHDDGACPYFLKMGDNHLLLYYCHASGAKYLIGKYDAESAKFHPFNGGRINAVTQRGGYCAPSGFSNPDGSVTGIYVMHSYFNESLMSIPHTLTIGGEHNDKLCIKPAIDLSPYYTKTASFEDIKVPKNTETVIEGVSVRSTELYFELTDKSMQCFEIRFCRSNDGDEYTAIQFYPNMGTCVVIDDQFPPRSIVAVDCSHSTYDKKISPPETKEVLLSESDPLKLRIFVDKGVFEVFINDREVIGKRFFPSENSTGISFISRGADATVNKLTASQIPVLNTKNYL